MTRHPRSNRALRSAFRLRHIALLATLVLFNTAPAPAAAAPAGDLVFVDYYLHSVPPDLTVCVRDDTSIEVYAVKTIRTISSVFAPLGTVVAGTVVGQPLFARLSNGSMGRLDPSSSNMEPSYTQISLSSTGRTTAHATFRFTAGDQPGSTDIIIGQAAGMPPPNYDDLTVHVEVKRCKYRIKATGDWDINSGFYPHAHAEFEAEVEPDEDGEFDVLETFFANAQWRSTPTCPGAVAAYESKVRIKGSAEYGYLGFTGTYDETPTKAEIVCNLPMAGPIKGKNEKPGEALQWTLARLEVEVGTAAYQTTSKTVVTTIQSGDGTWTGRTRVDVTTIPE